MSSTSGIKAIAPDYSQLQTACLATLTKHLPIAIWGRMAYLMQPSDPDFCCADFVYYVTRAIENTIWTTKNVELWDAWWIYLYIFTTKKRTDREVEQLVRDFSICLCDDSKDFEDVHGHIDSSPMVNGVRAPQRENAVLFFSFAFRMLNDALREAHVTATTKGVAQRWPRGYHDLTILGELEDVVTSMVQWDRHLKVFSDFSPVATLVPTLLKLRHKDIYKAIAESNLVGMTCINTIDERFISVVDDLVKVKGNLQVVQSTQHYILSGYDIEEAITCFEHAFIPPINYNINLLGQSDMSAVLLCSSYLYTLPILGTHFDPKKVQQWTLRLATIGYILFQHVAANHPVYKNAILHPAIVERDAVIRPVMEAINANLEDRIALAIVLCRNFRQCSLPNCFLTFSECGAAFQTCRGCKTAGYSSRECATKDWKDPKLWHKRMCKIIALITDEEGIWSDDNPEPHYRTHELMKRISARIKQLKEDNELKKEDLEYAGAWAGTILYDLCPEVGIKNRNPSTQEHSLPNVRYTAAVKTLVGFPLLKCPKPKFMENTPIPSLTNVKIEAGQKARDTSLVFAFPFTGMKYNL